jgi:hypothetical protein
VAKRSASCVAFVKKVTSLRKYAPRMMTQCGLKV